MRENGGRTGKDEERRGVESWVGKIFELEGEENQKREARMEWVPGCGDDGARGGGEGRVQQWVECGGGGRAVRWEFGEGTADKKGPGDGDGSCAVF